MTKVYFPKEVFPAAAVMASCFDFVIASAALLAFLLVIRIGWSAQLGWIPLLLVTMIVLALGIAMIVSAAGLFFRDVKYIVEVVLTFGIFFTPVLFDIRMLGDKGNWLLLNPIAPVLEGFSNCIVRHQAPNLPWLWYSLVVGLTSLCFGYVFFKHMEPSFAESI